MDDLQFEVLRQLLSNQFTILKYVKTQTGWEEICEERLYHTDKLLKRMYGGRLRNGSQTQETSRTDQV